MRLEQRVHISRRITLLSYAALLAALITGWLADSPSLKTLDILFIKSLPLLIFLPGLVRGSSMVHIWMSFVLLLYVIKAVVDLSLGMNVIFSAIESVSSITLFTTTMLFVRYSRLLRLEQSRQQNPE